jgi:hypothetical protein
MAEENQRSQMIRSLGETELRNFLLSHSIKEKHVTQLIQQGLDGQMLHDFTTGDFEQLGIPKAPAIQICNIRDKFLTDKVKERKASGKHQFVREFGKPPQPNLVYVKGNFLKQEIGASSLFEPAREFKSIIDSKEKLIKWLKKFIIGCLNRSCNGTIYFGVQDKPHGMVSGINIKKSDFHKYQDLVDQHFIVPGAIQFHGIRDSQLRNAVSMCVKPIQFVPVEGGGKDEELYVIEIDVEASWNICQEILFYTKPERTEPCEIYIRRGAHTFSKQVKGKYLHDDKEMKAIEEEILKYRKDRFQKEQEFNAAIEDFDTKLRRLVCQGRQRIEDEEFRYFLLYNKPDANGGADENLEYFQWISKIKWTLVLDFDVLRSFLKLTTNEETLVRKPKVFDVATIRQLLSRGSDELRRSMAFGEYTSWLACNKEDQDLKEWHGEDKGTIYKTLESMTDAEGIEDPRKIVLIVILDSMDAIDKISYIMKDLNTMGLAQSQFVCFYRDQSVMECLERKIGDIFHGELWNKQQVQLSSWSHLNSFFVEKTQLTFKYNGIQLPCSSPGLMIALNSTANDYYKKEGIDILGSKHCEDLKDRYNDDELTEYANREILGFFKGSEPTWELFYYSNPSCLPMTGKIYPGVIKREFVDSLVKDIGELNKYQNTIVARKRIIHQPGAGASTIAKHVLWKMVTTAFLTAASCP